MAMKLGVSKRSLGSASDDPVRSTGCGRSPRRSSLRYEWVKTTSAPSPRPGVWSGIVHRRTRSSAASVALLCTGVAIVAAGLATSHLAMVATGVLVIVLGWVTAASGAVRPMR
jgi:hypothetical protein